MFTYFTKGELTPHPCAKDGCPFLALYDDEPFCVGHSEDPRNRGVEGYSYIQQK